MQKRSSGMTSLMWYIKRLYRYDRIEITFLRWSLKVLITGKRGSQAQSPSSKKDPNEIIYHELININCFIIFIFIITHSFKLTRKFCNKQ